MTKEQSVDKSDSKSETYYIIFKILIFVVPFIIIFVMSRSSGKSYTNSMADYTIYKRYFALIIFAIFLLMAVYMAFVEYESYRRTNDEHSYMLFKVSLGMIVVFLLFIGLTIFFINRLKNMSVKQRARVEAFNRTTNATRTAFDIFRR